MTIDTEFESRLTTMLHDRADGAMNNIEIGAPLMATPVRRRSRGLSLAVVGMAAVTVAGLIAIRMHASDNGKTSTAVSDSEPTTESASSVTSGSTTTLAQASNWLNQQCLLLRQHQIPEHMTTQEAAAICTSEVGIQSLGQFGFLAAADQGDGVSTWLSVVPQAITDCLHQAGLTASRVTSEEPALLDAPAGAPSDTVEACWKFTLIELRLVDENVGMTPTDSPTLTTTLGTFPDVTSEPTIASTTTLP